MTKPEEREENHVDYFELHVEYFVVNIGVFLCSAVLSAIFGVLAAWNTINEFLPFLANARAWGIWVLLFCGLVEAVALIFRFHRYCLISLPIGLFVGFIVGYCLGFCILEIVCVSYFLFLIIAAL
jgi:hypothetical protein